MNGCVQRYCVCVMAAVMLLLAAPQAFAISAEQQKYCEGKDDASPDLRITSCTTVIEQTKAKKQKTEAFISRGKAYRAKGDSEHAIRDFDEAIKIDAKDGDAFYNRGLALRDRGDSDRALQDLEQAVKINPKNAVGLNTLS